MSAEPDQWENVYSAFDVGQYHGTLDWFIEDIRSELPAPRPSPTCVKRGHDWSTLTSWWPNDTRVEGCRRCAARGMLFFRTTDIRVPPAEDSAEDGA